MRKLFLLFVSFVATTTLWAHDFEVDGIYYNYLEDNNVEVTYRGDYYHSYAQEYSGEVTIPSTVTHNGTTYSVTKIGKCAFWDCSSLTSITIPNSVTSIGDMAFYGCSSLISITIPNSVTSIGDHAFTGCSSLPVENNLRYADTYLVEAVDKTLSTYSIKEGTKWIGGGAFERCSSLTSVTIPNSVTSIGDGTFYGCSSLPVENNLRYADTYLVEAVDETLSTYSIKEGTKWIGDGAFYGCFALTSITIGNSVTSIGWSAFGGCSSLTSITVEKGNSIYDSRENCNAVIETATNTLIAGCQNTIIPNSVTSIGLSAFYRCSSLTSITIPNSVTSIGVGAFDGCESLTSITIPNSVTTIGDGAFCDCFSLTSITIPNSVTSIGEYAFYECSSLTSITIPNSVTSIGDDAFSYCSALTSITIPNSVTSIGSSVFYNCSSLTSITIPNSVTSIGSSAFSNCTNLTSIICLGITPPNASNLGANTTTCTLTVPQSAYNAYLRHNYWGQFLNINTGYLVTLQTNNDQWGEVAGTNLYTQDTTITITATPYEGYTFMRWSDGNTDNPRTLTITQDTTLTAEFAIEGGCLVTFVDWDGTVLSTVSVVPGDAATAPADPTREGYTFIGWDKDFSHVTDHMTVTAQYQINRYRVRFFDYDDTLLKTDSVEYQAAATAPANPYREGYTFIGWNQELDSITADLDVHAQYEFGEDRDMTIVFTNSEDNDSEIYSQSLTIKVPAAPEIEGFIFLGWQPVATLITDTITIQAIYENNVPSSSPEVYVNPANPAQKLLRNGQVYILQDGKTYTITGQKL